jgi:hypothetical protein
MANKIETVTTTPVSCRFSLADGQWTRRISALTPLKNLIILLLPRFLVQGHLATMLAKFA